MNNIHINDFQGKNVHFIGIGGISMSALAEILLSQNYKVSGSDLSDSNLLRKLALNGATIFIGHSPHQSENADIIIYTAAVKQDNPEMKSALEKGIPMLQRAELLGQIMESYPLSIGVAGCHGKTTTTSMISTALLKADLDPTLLIGGELASLDGNVRIGQSSLFVTEACEYVGSFLHFKPFVAIILNIDLDHLDYFRDIDHIYDTFLQYAMLVPKDGFVIGCKDDHLVAKLLKSVKSNVLSFGISEDADIQAKNILFDANGCANFDVTYKELNLGHFSLKVPGQHNVYNTLASIASFVAINAASPKVFDALQEYSGTKRRFELKGLYKDITIVDDYAHHPTEIAATLRTARTLKHKNIWCVFQPHTFTRTIKLFDDFVNILKEFDHIIVTGIYSAREIDTHEVSSKQLSEAISEKGADCIYISDFQEIASHLKLNANPGDLVITMGAGDVYLVGEILLRNN